MTIFIFLLIETFGYLFLSFWEKEILSKIERLALGFLVGLGFTTYFLFIMGIVSVALTNTNLIILLLVLILVLLILVKPKLSKIIKTSGIKFTSPITILSLAIIMVFCVSIIQTIYWPPSSWDSIALYDFRAKAFTQTNSLASEVLTAIPDLASYSYTYPFFTSLAHAIVYLSGGENPQFLYSLIFLSFLIVFYFRLRNITNKTMAMFITLLISLNRSFFYHSTISYANLPFAVYYGLSTIFLWQWSKSKKTGELAISVILLGLSAWVRSTEPFWIINLMFIFVRLLSIRNFLKLGICLLFFFVIRQSWQIYYANILSGIVDPAIGHINFYFNFSKIIPVSEYVLNNLIISKEFLPVLFVFLLAISSNITKIFREKTMISFLVLYLIFFWGGTYFFSINYSWWNRIGDSVSRVSFFLIPLLLYGIIVFFHTIPKKK
jgi:hypothetical protein